MRHLLKASQLIDHVCAWFLGLAGAACLLLVLVTTQQVIWRYFFNESSVGMQELELHLFAAVFLLALAATFTDDEHVRVDIFYSHFSQQRQALINIIGITLFLVPTSLVMTYYGWEFTQTALSFTSGRASDHFIRQVSDPSSWGYQTFAPLEALLRSTILVGETSPDPGGLAARWIPKSLVFLGGGLLLLQALSQLIKNTARLSLGADDA